MDRTEAEADIAHLIRSYVALIEEPEPRGLELLRGLRGALARLYPSLIGLPSRGPAMTSRTRGSASDDLRVELGLIARLPPDLYWSALRPLTWDTVGDRGARDLAQTLVDVWSWLKPHLVNFENGGPGTAFLYMLGVDMPETCRPLLEALTILQEAVTDLDAYGREWGS